MLKPHEGAEPAPNEAKFGLKMPKNSSADLLFENIDKFVFSNSQLSSPTPKWDNSTVVIYATADFEKNN